MRLKTFVSGLMPRSKELRRALRSYQKGNIDAATLEKSYIEEAEKYISIQKDAGCEFIQDGMLKWQDLLRPLCNYGGVKEGTLIRWFETNFFYRMPIVEDKITYKGPVISNHVITSSLKKDSKSSLTIPDPITFAILCENRYYNKISELVSDLSNAMIRDLEILDLDVKAIIIHSPAIGYFGIENEDMNLFADFLKQVGSLKKGIKVIVHLSFIKNPRILNSFSKLELDTLSLDLCYGNRLEILKYIPDVSSLSLGLIDVSTSFIEDKEYLIFEINRILSSRNLREVYVTNSTDLDLLPYEVALQKINILKELSNYEL